VSSFFGEILGEIKLLHYDDYGLDLYYVLFWNYGRLTECVVRNEFDYYALVAALKKI